MEVNEKLIRDNVRNIRLAKGIMGSHVARALDVSRQGYHSMENGNQEINSERLKIIGKVLNVKPAVFFDQRLTDSVIKKEKRGN
jgi:transcriptional regulator with XRE-family HTH domain